LGAAALGAALKIFFIAIDIKLLDTALQARLESALLL